MFCDEGLPFSLCSSVLLLVAITLESVPLAVGFVLITILSNLQVHAYTIPLDDNKKEIDKNTVAIQQKYKCANFVEREEEKYKCLLVDGIFDEAGYKLLGNKVYCPMCYSALKKNKQ